MCLKGCACADAQNSANGIALRTRDDMLRLDSMIMTVQLGIRKLLEVQSVPPHSRMGSLLIGGSVRSHLIILSHMLHAALWVLRESAVGASGF